MNTWEAKAKKLYKDHPAQHKAISAGKNIDNSLGDDYSKMGVSNCRFPMDQYLAYFDYHVLVTYGIINKLFKL